MLNKFLVQTQHNGSVLIYGENFGKVMDYFKKLTNNLDCNDPFSATMLSFHDVVNNSKMLLDKVNTPAFNGKKRLIHITDVSESLPAQIQQVIDHVDYHTTFLIFTSKLTLTPKSTLRLFFEKSSTHAAIACYNDDGRDLKAFISHYLQQNDIQCSSSLIANLSNILAGERTAIRYELDKLIAYAGEKRTLNDADHLICLTAHNTMNNYDICSAFADKNLEKFLLLLKNYRDGLLVIRILSQYFIRIKTALVAPHDMRDSVIRGFKPPIFFKYMGRFKLHLDRWQKSKVIEVLNELLKMEVKDKENSVCNTKAMIERMAIHYLA